MNHKNKGTKPFEERECLALPIPSPFLVRLFLLLFLNVLYLSAHAQLFTLQEGGESKESVQEPPKDSLGRDTPQGTVKGFISAVGERNYELAGEYLNLDAYKGEKTSEELARLLEELFDQGSIQSYALISNEKSGYKEDGLEPNVDKVGSVSSGKKTVDITVERRKTNDSTAIWLFSASTIQNIIEIKPEKELLADRVLPGFLSSHYWFGAPLGHWLIMILLFPSIYFLSKGLIILIVLLLKKLWKKANTTPTEGIIKAMELPVKLYLAGILFVSISNNIGISIVLRQRFGVLMMVLGLVALIILLWRLTGFLGEFSKQRMIRRGSPSGMSVVLFMQRAAKITIVILGGILVLSLFGIDVTAGLAALGIGGIALALGAQTTMENFVGSVTLIADQPVRVGDFCKVGDVIGTIESIGMRSTRIRTLNRTIVTIPNGQFSSSTIENYAHRDQFWFYHTLTLRYETSPDQIRYLLVKLRSVLYAHPKVDPDPARVRFVALDSASLNLEIFAYIKAMDYNEFLEVQEDLLLRMMDIVEESGSGFAFPSQTIYFAKDDGLSKEKSQQAEEQVKKWQEEKDMQIPRFAEEKINKMRNTIPYPPEGSVMRKKD